MISGVGMCEKLERQRFEAKELIRGVDAGAHAHADAPHRPGV